MLHAQVIHGQGIYDNGIHAHVTHALETHAHVRNVIQAHDIYTKGNHVHSHGKHVHVMQAYHGILQRLRVFIFQPHTSSKKRKQVFALADILLAVIC
jgi:hypothetical protein